MHRYLLAEKPYQGDLKEGCPHQGVNAWEHLFWGQAVIFRVIGMAPGQGAEPVPGSISALDLSDLSGNSVRKMPAGRGHHMPAGCGFGER